MKGTTMDNNDLFGGANGNQFVISYALLAVLQWLNEHSSDELKVLISEALDQGLEQEIQLLEQHREAYLAEDAQEAIVEFFSLLEGALSESIEKQAIYKKEIKQLLPSLEQIDSHEYDPETVRSSVEYARKNMREEPEQNMREHLYRELLRRWKPNKKPVNN